MFAVKYGNLNLVRQLIKNGANLNIRDKHCGETALQIAIGYGHYTIAWYLIANGGNFLDVTWVS